MWASAATGCKHAPAQSSWRKLVFKVWPFWHISSQVSVENAVKLLFFLFKLCKQWAAHTTAELPSHVVQWAGSLAELITASLHQVGSPPATRDVRLRVVTTSVQKWAPDDQNHHTWDLLDTCSPFSSWLITGSVKQNAPAVRNSRLQPGTHDSSPVLLGCADMLVIRWDQISSSGSFRPGQTLVEPQHSDYKTRPQNYRWEVALMSSHLSASTQ